MLKYIKYYNIIHICIKVSMEIPHALRN